MVASLPATRTPAARIPGGALHTRLFAELCAAALLLTLSATAGFYILSFYQDTLLPLRRPIATPVPPVGVRLDDRDAVERLQRTMLLLGEASAYRSAQRADWAEETLAAALALSPANPEALAMRADWDRNPLPPPTPEQLAALVRQERVLELLGATIALLDAHDPLPAPILEEARSYLSEALALEPTHPTVLALTSRLTQP